MTKSERLAKGTFKKCDMHVHSSSCYSRFYDKKAFFESVLDSDLDVVAVTDHNVIDVTLLNELQEQMAAKGKVLFAGVEINVQLKDATIQTYGLTLGKGKKGEYFHSIVWFDIAQAQAMTDILKELFIPMILGSAEDAGLTEESLRAMSPKELSGHTKGKAIFLEDFQERAAAIPHFFVPHENKDRSLSEYLPNGSKDNPLYKNTSYKDRLFYYSHAMAVEGGQKSRKHISEGLAEELHTTLAALFFSDAKNVGDIGKRFTWIDFDGDLESLLLAISDPESRIRTSDECPALPQTNTSSFLESVTFNTLVNGDKARGHKETIRFSPGYNGIVGSRGSGKTLLACLLSGKGLDVYSDYIDKDSVSFLQHGGIPSGNRPRCLYLGQGELQSIYEAGKYERIPFLSERVAPLRELAEEEQKKARERLMQLFKLEKDMLVAFISKYPNESVRIDYLDTEVPSGITIDQPQYPSTDRTQLSQAKTDLNKMTEGLADLIATSKTVHFNPSYPEDKVLFAALNQEISEIRNDLESAQQRVVRLATMLNECDDEWFKKREELLSLFKALLATYNNESSSITLNQYHEKEQASKAFLEDLFRLRSFLRYLDKETSEVYERVLAPLEPEVFSSSEEEIVVELKHTDDTSLEEKVDQLFSADCSPNSQTLIRAFLYQYDSSRMHKCFKGTKYRSVANGDITAHINKYFDQLNEIARSAGALRTEVAIAGKSIDDMSPGMKAQALLKLFLNDSVTSGDWTYIVLDQPEDNLDVATIKDFLIDRIKKLKLNVQFFVVSHSAPVIVNGDARTVVVCKNDNGDISYCQGAMNEQGVKQSIANVLDGGERYLKMRLNKYNFQVGDKR